MRSGRFIQRSALSSQPHHGKGKSGFQVKAGTIDLRLYALNYGGKTLVKRTKK
jgi:hypothetical protein